MARRRGIVHRPPRGERWDRGRALASEVALLDTLVTLAQQHADLFGRIAAISLALTLLGALGAPWVVARLPPDHLVAEHPPLQGLAGRPLLRALLLLARNVFAILLIVAGILMLVLPGQGLLTIAVGIGISDLPLRRRLVRALLTLPGVWGAVAWIRRRAEVPPLERPDDV